MKVIIAGSRTISPSVEGIIEYLYDTLVIINKPDWEDLEVVSGGASGVDAAAEKFAGWHTRPFTKFEADWNTHGKAAGPIRNKQMAEYADALLLIWDGESKGSANMKMNMEKLGKPVHEVILKIPKTKKILFSPAKVISNEDSD